LIANRAAVKRVTDATQTGAILGSAGKGAAWGAATGEVLGAAFGVLTNESVAEATGKGAAVGAAGGAVYGGAKAGTDTDRHQTIADDIRDKVWRESSYRSRAVPMVFCFFQLKPRVPESYGCRSILSSQAKSIPFPYLCRSKQSSRGRCVKIPRLLGRGIEIISRF
jgi:hypothetical protein